MSIPDGAAHIVVSGVCASSESFAFGFWFDNTSGPGGADLDLSSTWGSFRNTLLGHMTSDQVITAYDDYEYSGGVVSFHDHVDVSHPGTDTSGQLPLQTSCVLTLRTATLSRRGRGRLYLPTCGFSLMSGSEHKFAASQVNGLVDTFAAYLATGGAGGTPAVVVSRMGSAMHVITSVDADLVPDTQRRRTNKLTSIRHSASV
jgi:hypothetical protein